MTNEEVAVMLTDHENEIGSLKHRMAAVENNQRALTELTGSVRELTIEQGHLKSDVGEIKADVKAMLDKPGKRWDSMVDKALWLLAGAFLAWVLAGMPGVAG